MSKAGRGSSKPSKIALPFGILVSGVLQALSSRPAAWSYLIEALRNFVSSCVLPSLVWVVRFGEVLTVTFFFPGIFVHYLGYFKTLSNEDYYS